MCNYAKVADVLHNLQRYAFSGRYRTLPSRAPLRTPSPPAAIAEKPSRNASKPPTRPGFPGFCPFSLPRRQLERFPWPIFRNCVHGERRPKQPKTCANTRGFAHLWARTGKICVEWPCLHIFRAESKKSGQNSPFYTDFGEIPGRGRK